MLLSRERFRGQLAPTQLIGSTPLRCEIARYLRRDQLDLRYLARLRLEPPRMTDAECVQLEDASGIARVRGDANTYLTNLPEPDRQLLTQLLRWARISTQRARWDSLSSGVVLWLLALYAG